MRALTTAVLVALSPLAARGEPACRWLPWTEAPLLTVDARVVYLSARPHPDVTACLPRRQNPFKVFWEELRDGAWAPVREDRFALGSSVDERLFPSGYCERKPAPTSVRARIEPPPELAEAAFVAAPVEVADVCRPECRGGPSIGVVRQGRQGQPEGKVELEGSIGESWLACVRARPKSGGKLTLRVFVGKSQPEVLAAIRPSIARVVEVQAGPFKTALQLCEVCRDAQKRWLSVEFAGTGMYESANGGGRAVTRLDCPLPRPLSLP